nr:collagen alpha-1(I) chain [Taeniopygia guttata]
MLPSVTLKCVGATLRSKRESACAAAQQRDGSELGIPGEPEPCRAPGRGCATREHARCGGSRTGSPGSAVTVPGAPSQAGGSEPGRGLRARPGALRRNRCDRPRCRPVPSRREPGNRGGAICPALPCHALPCPALPCPRIGPTGGPGPAVRGSPVGAAKVAETRVYDSRQDTAVQTPLCGHATRGTEPGQPPRSLTGAGSGQGRAARRSRASPPPAEPRSAPGALPFPSAVTAGAQPGLRPPALPAGCAERMGWDGMGWERGGRRRPGCGSGSGCQDAVTMGTRCRPGGGSPSHRPLLAAIPRQCPILGKQRGTGRAPQTAALPAARGASGGDGAGAVPRLPRPQTPASRQKVPW